MPSKAILYCAIGIMVACLCVQAANAQLEGSCNPGTVIYNYKGINVYSNGADQYSGTPLCGLGSYGPQYECTEFVRRFYGTIYGANSTVPASGASPWTGNADQYFLTAPQRKLIAFPNGGPTPPAADDIIVFESPNPADGGHVAIAEGPPTGVPSASCSSTLNPAFTLPIAEQNWNAQGQACLTVNFDGTNYTVTRPNSAYTIKGWLHYPGSAGLAPFVSFTEGNPGVPGDGRLVSANSNKEFDFSSPIPLASITNGLTFTVFLPPNTSSPVSIQINVFPTDGNAACSTGAGFGESPIITTTYGNVVGSVEEGFTGYAFNLTQAALNSLVTTTNRLYPSCNVSLASLQVTSLLVYTGINTPATSLDAVAVGIGQNVLP